MADNNHMSNVEIRSLTGKLKRLTSGFLILLVPFLTLDTVTSYVGLVNGFHESNFMVSWVVEPFPALIFPISLVFYGILFFAFRNVRFKTPARNFTWSLCFLFFSVFLVCETTFTGLHNLVKLVLVGLI